MLNEIHKNSQMLKEKEQNNTFLYVLPDTENRFVEVFEITNPSCYEIQKEWMNIIANAYAEYYKNTDVYDNAKQDIGTIELVLNVIKTNNIPLVRYWRPCKVEMLSVRWLNQQI